MDIKIKNFVENMDITTFTIENVDVSIVNALRRIILSEINTVVFKTTPYSENKTNIITNTTRMNNEILKQRISCIPIHIKDSDINEINNYVVELNVTNDTDKILNVTTRDFKIKNKVSGEYLPESKTKQIFKPYLSETNNNEYYILLLYLRPKLSEEIPGEKIELTSEFSISNSRNNGMYNVVSTCSYSNTVDELLMMQELENKKKVWKDENILSKEEIVNEIENWKLLDGLRYYKKNSFDFIIQTVGVFTNNEILHKACNIMIDKIKTLENQINNNSLVINESKNTMSNCFDIILENEDYTLGNIMNFILYKKYVKEDKTMSYCGFKKLHPHDDYSIIRIAYYDKVDRSVILLNLQTTNEIIKDIFIFIDNLFE